MVTPSERGESNINLAKLEQIADIFDVDLVELMSFGEKPVVCWVGDRNTGFINYDTNGYPVFNGSTNDLASDLAARNCYPSVGFFSSC